MSGSIFMDNRPFADYLKGAFDASVLDMETAAIAVVAHANDTPFVAFRAVSDVAAAAAASTQYRSFQPLAAKNAAQAAVSLFGATQD